MSNHFVGHFDFRYRLQHLVVLSLAIWAVCFDMAAHAKPKFSPEALEMARDYGHLIRAKRGQYPHTMENIHKLQALKYDKLDGKPISCVHLAESIFYYRHQHLIDTLDTSPFHELYYDVLEDRHDTTIPTDPRKVVVMIKYNRQFGSNGFYDTEENLAKLSVASKGINIGVCSDYLKAVGLFKDK